MYAGQDTCRSAGVAAVKKVFTVLISRDHYFVALRPLERERELYVPYALSLRSDPDAVGQGQPLVQYPGDVEGAAFPLDHEVGHRQSVPDDGC